MLKYLHNFVVYIYPKHCYFFKKGERDQIRKQRVQKKQKDKQIEQGKSKYERTKINTKGGGQISDVKYIESESAKENG